MGSGIRGIRNDLLTAVAAATVRKNAADAAADAALREQAAATRAVSEAWEALTAEIKQLVAAAGVEETTTPGSPQSEEEGGPQPTSHQESAIARLNDEHGVKTWGWLGPEEEPENLSLIVTLDDGRRVYVGKDGLVSPVHDRR